MSQPSRLLALFVAQRGSLVVEAERLTCDRGAAEDVVQEAWLRIAGATPANGIAEPEGYLRRIVRNLALDEYRRRRRREHVTSLDPAADPAEIASNDADAARSLIAVQELGLVTAELARMPPRMRRAVELHRLSGARLHDIARELGVSVTTAHKLVTDGVERCRLCLGCILN